MTVQATPTEVYTSPSSATGGNELSSLLDLTQVLSDTLDVTAGPEALAGAVATAATASTFDLAFSVVENPLAPAELRSEVLNAWSYPADRVPADYPTGTDFLSGESIDRVQAFRLDLALANLGTALSRRVTGRISAEVDVRIAHDADALVARARALARQFAADGLARDRLLLRIPSTLEGAQAIRALQDEGLACHAIFCYSFAQAEAVAGFGGAEVVQYGLSRVRDWHRKYPNVPRDPHGPREDSGYASDVDPAALVLDDIWALCAGRLDGKARVIVSGVRTRKDALSVAGVDYLIAPSNVLEELARTPTREGYNDGMGGLSSDEQGGGVTRALSRPAARARASALPPCPHTGPNGFDSKAFNKTISKAGADLLRESLERHVKHVEDLTRGMAEYATKRG